MANQMKVLPQVLFVYGTLAPNGPNEHILVNIGGTWQPGTVRGRLHEAGWGADMGYPGLTLDEQGESVKGFLFYSTQLHDHWAVLDEFEGNEYERVVAIAALSDGSQVETFVYVLKQA